MKKKTNSETPLDLTILTNKDFAASNIAYQITEIIPFSSDETTLNIKTLENTKINILTHRKDGSVFF